MGVEGVDDSVIIDAVKRSGALDIQAAPRGDITRLDMYQLGLSGGASSRALRRRLCQSLDLPRQISTSDLLKVLNMMLNKNQLEEILTRAENMEV